MRFRTLFALLLSLVLVAGAAPMTASAAPRGGKATARQVAAKKHHKKHKKRNHKKHAGKKGKKASATKASRVRHNGAK